MQDKNLIPMGSRRLSPPQFCIYVASHFADDVPRMPGVSVIPYLLPMAIQAFEQITFKICLDFRFQVRRIAGPAQKACPALYYVLSQGSYVGRDYRQAETIGQEKNTTLEDVRIRQC